MQEIKEAAYQRHGQHNHRHERKRSGAGRVQQDGQASKQGSDGADNSGGHELRSNRGPRSDGLDAKYFPWSCFGCGQVGHRQRDCPQNDGALRRQPPPTVASQGGGTGNVQRGPRQGWVNPGPGGDGAPRLVPRDPGTQGRQPAVPGAPSTTRRNQVVSVATSSQAPSAAEIQGTPAVAQNTRSRAPPAAAHERATTRQHAMLSSAGGD